MLGTLEMMLWISEAISPKSILPLCNGVRYWLMMFFIDIWLIDPRNPLCTPNSWFRIGCIPLAKTPPWNYMCITFDILNYDLNSKTLNCYYWQCEKKKTVETPTEIASMVFPNK